VAPFKTINDTVHGTIRLEGIVLDLLETLEIQRLNSIRQLGLTYLVFPGANHSRIEHVIGVSHVAGQIADAFDLPEAEKDLVMAAGLLHDVGHGPFSHTLEHVLSHERSLDHMKLTQRIIKGDEDNVAPQEREEFPDVPRIPEVIRAHGLKPAEVASLVEGVPVMHGLRGLGEPAKLRGKRYLAQIIHSTVDADQVDYLMRDAHYTGAGGDAGREGADVLLGLLP
jgi:HD superfamily phosphohydrolase